MSSKVPQKPCFSTERYSKTVKDIQTICITFVAPCLLMVLTKHDVILLKNQWVGQQKICWAKLSPHPFNPCCTLCYLPPSCVVCIDSCPFTLVKMHFCCKCCTHGLQNENKTKTKNTLEIWAASSVQSFRMVFQIILGSFGSKPGNSEHKALLTLSCLFLMQYKKYHNSAKVATLFPSICDVINLKNFSKD